MGFQEWLRERRCRNCGSSEVLITGQATAAAMVTCRECSMVLSSWDDVVKAAREARRTTPARRPKNRTRSPTVEVWRHLACTKGRKPAGRSQH
jgi:hypothetical protein